MTLKELAKEYRESAQLLRVRLKELRAAKKATADPDERFEIDRRIAELTPMLTHTNKVAETLEHYYEKGFWRGEEFTANCFNRRFRANAAEKETLAANHTERADGGPEGYMAGILCQRFYNPGHRKRKKGKQVHGVSLAEKSRRKNSENIEVPLTTADADNIVNQFLRKKEK